ncbi:MAG TPA: glycosyl transferase family 1, partial [Candidatus Dorea intestinavium]|nr:glycosyl transferase family 1 [Candidatus Dorea intestinavium]
MRILNISAQKPHSTGSGVYLRELVKVFQKKGYQQGVVPGVYTDDKVEFPREVAFYPVYFNQGKLPFNIPGMSDEMPYKSTKYSEMTSEMVKLFKEEFLQVIDQAVKELNPDIILCHHLYLLTAFVREKYPNKKIFGICHNTDIRQFIKTDLKRD